jgi:hypothetical protein
MIWGGSRERNELEQNVFEHGEACPIVNNHNLLFGSARKNAK